MLVLNIFNKIFMKKLKKEYPITGFTKVNTQLINDQIESRKSMIKKIEDGKHHDLDLSDDELIKFHKNAIKELKEMMKEIN